MRQNELEKRLVEEIGLTPAAARDEVEEVVRRVLASLRKGRTAELPGVGRLTVKKVEASGPKAARK
jgi:nucleoid DNA-binding protein